MCVICQTNTSKTKAEARAFPGRVKCVKCGTFSPSHSDTCRNAGCDHHLISPRRLRHKAGFLTGKARKK